MPAATQELIRSKEEYRYGFHDDVKPIFATTQGLSEAVVREISAQKGEPEWMLQLRLKALRFFFERPMPPWGPDLSQINFDDIIYYIKSSQRTEHSWDEVPEKIRKTFERLGIPEAEQKFLGGVGAQYESETVYHSLREDLAKKGVLFMSMDEGLKQYPELVRKYFGTIVPANDNKFAALNSAVWSGGSFVYVPPGVHVDMPLQAYFRINAERVGQFERTLIIADEGSSVHYIEGCTAPTYSKDSLHTAVVEVIAHKNAKVRYTTIQNWSSNVYNLVTKRAHAHEGATVEWVDGNLGCLASDTNILVNSDVKPISRIETGDMVFALNDKFELERRTVLGKKYNGRKPVFKLMTENHREVVATTNHPFLSTRKIGKHNTIAWRRLDEIRPGDMVAISGNVPDYGKPYRLKSVAVQRVRKHIKVPEATTDELMWFLGFYLGDGCLERARVTIAVPPKDKSYQRVVTAFKSIFGLQPKLHRNIALRGCSAELVQFIRELGFVGTASTKRVPSWVYTLPQSQRRAFIEGYVAADGHVKKNHKNMSVTSCNRALLEDIKQLSISCGLNPLKISKWTRKEKKPLGKIEKEYTHYSLYFADWTIKDPVAFTRVSSIEPAGETDTWDIEIDGAHNFVANGFIVHNSKVTMKYPSVYLLGPNAKADILSIAFAGAGQHQDAGAKVVHLAPSTSSRIISKSVSTGGGRTTYRGLVRVGKGCKDVKSFVSCDALILDEKSASDTIPYMEINEDDVTIAHEATVGRISEEALFYLMSRGLREDEAMAMIVKGFLEAFTKELPMEYAIELNRLIELEMEGAVG